ncbi:hypothetical protein ET445_05595 [Agromyces protaetiae]|uniref:Uncharacterized protein n=1 Tax=Agromyces protaetiae TaxID=2509455 RepID=A0A4P6FD52_9MICO|nr:hypothetical protein [Agromyces protaetiae]QAY72893.1 hypothetical protein ET445_05595 [Agromyces protaetiae]
MGDESDDVSVAPISAQGVGQWAVPLFIVAGVVIVGLIVTVIVLARRRPPGTRPDTGSDAGTDSGFDPSA